MLPSKMKAGMCIWLSYTGAWYLLTLKRAAGVSWANRNYDISKVDFSDYKSVALQVTGFLYK